MKIESGKQRHDATAMLAEEWFARLRSPEVTAGDVKTFNKWLAENKKHQEVFDSLQAMWIQFQDLGGLPHISQVQKLKSRMIREQQIKGKNKLTANQASHQILSIEKKSPVRRFAPLQRVAVAASIVLALGAAVFFSMLSEDKYQNYYTSLGEQKVVWLADGTRVTLNTKTNLDVRINDNIRDILLLSGQAEFDVAKDKDRPFVVTIDKGKVTALGTRFDIYKAPKRNIVTLVEGSISVELPDPDIGRAHGGSSDSARMSSTSSARKVVLNPGEQAHFSGDGILSAAVPVDLAKVTAWREGKMYFDDTPLDRAIEEVNRYARIKLELASPELAEFAISGVFEIGRSEEVAHSAEILFGLESHRKNHEWIVLSKSEK